MAGEIVARRYADAFFDLARDAKAIAAYEDDLARAAETLSNTEVLDALGNPRLDIADRVRLALALIDGTAEHTRNLVRLLVERNRIALLSSVLEQFRLLADRESGVVRAAVTAAIPLTAALQEEITASLRERLGGDVQVTVAHDPAILGGLVIRVGDRVIDNSLRTHLQQLQASLQ
ncbi:MAG: F0F1 ATP synthase subunit delta [Solirubrobacteraceae bacterium]